MARRGLFLVEHGDADGLDILVVFVERRDVHEAVHVGPVPLQEDHAAIVVLGPFFQFGDEVFLVGGVNQALDLGLVRRGQIFQLVNALVDIGKRQEVQHGVGWGQQPGNQPIAEEVAPQHVLVEFLVAGHVIEAAGRQKQRKFEEDRG